MGIPVQAITAPQAAMPNLQCQKMDPAHMGTQAHTTIVWLQMPIQKQRYLKMDPAHMDGRVRTNTA